MIPRASITAWRKTAPWPDNTQVEKDLVLSRALLLLFFVFVLCSPSAGLAEQEASDPEDMEQFFEELLVEYETVVTADRSEERAFETTRAIERVSREDIDKALPASVPEAIENVTGLFLQQTNRGAGAPILRGRIGPDNLILVDGVRFNTSTFRTGPNQYLATINLHAVDGIEVVRGPSSVLFGNGALGGVVNVITRDPEVTQRSFSSGGGVSAWLGSADRSGGGAASISAGAGPVAVLASGSLGYFGELRAGGGFVQPLTDYSQRGWFAKTVYEPSVDWRVTGAHLGSTMRDAGRVDRLGTGEIRFYDNTDYLSYVSARHRGRGVLGEARASLSHHRLVEGQRRFNCAPGVAANQCLTIDDSLLARERVDSDIVDSFGLDVTGRTTLLEDRLTILTGVDAYYDIVDSYAEQAVAETGFVFIPQSRGSFSPGSTYLTAGTFLHGRAVIHDRGPGAPKVRVEAGGRLSHFSGFAPDVPELGDVNYRYTGIVGSGGVQYYQPGRFNLYASFVQGFRAPNLQETTVLGTTGSKFEIPNEDLRPERSDTFELGAKAMWGPVGLSGAVFRSHIADAIDEEPALWDGENTINGAPVVQRVNAAKGLYQGVESRISLSLEQVELGADIAWASGDLTTPSGETHPARRVPPLFGSAQARYSDPKDRYYGALALRWAARQSRLHPSDAADPRICGVGDLRLEIDPSCDGTPGHFVLDAKLGVRLTTWSSIKLVAGNLGDVRYRTHGSGYDAPGFGVRAMLEMSF